MKKTILNRLRERKTQTSEYNKIKKSNLKNIIANYVENKKQKKIELLRKYLFPNLKKEEIRKISKYFKEEKKIYNQNWGKEGEIINNLYLLIKGEILINKNFKISYKKNNLEFCEKKINKFVKKNVCSLKNGFFIGLKEILQENKNFEFSYKIIKENSFVFKISKKNFFDVIKFKKIRKMIEKKKYFIFEFHFIF